MIKHITNITLFLLLLFFICTGGAKATDFFIGTSSTFSIDEEKDSLNTIPMDKALKNQPLPKKPFEMKKSPTWAVVQSLIIPGLGQFYNEDYWKAPLFLGAAAGLTYGIVYNWNKYNKFQALYDNSTTPIGKDTANTHKESYRDRRDSYGFYMLVVYIIAAVDAYTGAHLYDFDVSDEKMSFILAPNPYKGVSLNFILRF